MEEKFKVVRKSNNFKEENPAKPTPSVTIGTNSEILTRLRNAESRTKIRNESSDDELIELEFMEEANRIRAQLAQDSIKIDTPNELKDELNADLERMELDFREFVPQTPPRSNFNDQIAHNVAIVDSLPNHDKSQPITNHTQIYTQIAGTNDSDDADEGVLDEIHERLVKAQEEINARINQKDLDVKIVDSIDSNNKQESSIDSKANSPFMNEGEDIFGLRFYETFKPEDSIKEQKSSEKISNINEYVAKTQNLNIEQERELKNILSAQKPLNYGDLKREPINRNYFTHKLERNAEQKINASIKRPSQSAPIESAKILNEREILARNEVLIRNETLNKEPPHSASVEFPHSKNEIDNKSKSSEHYQLPDTSLLGEIPPNNFDIDDSEIDLKVQKLYAKLNSFKIKGDVVRTYSGPIVTTFEFRPAVDVKVSRIQNLQDDLSMALSAKSIRIQAPVPGKDVVGIEIPNNKMQTIYLREIFESSAFKNSNYQLAIALGKDVIGRPVVEDLATLPHLLVAGTTGSGKSVGINAMILSLLYKNTPDDLRLIMIDPKFLEFGLYKDIPHLLTPIITDAKKAIIALSKAVDEMNRRYSTMEEVRVKGIVAYNELAKDQNLPKMPYIVIIIDEFADLMIMGGRDAESSLISLASKARACGIHLIIATQRPTVNVVTGLIKSNLPTKISYRVGSSMDSKVILDKTGAETLLGRGDMLFSKMNAIVRMHAPFNSEKEIEKIVAFIKNQQEVVYDENFSLEPKEPEPSAPAAFSGGNDDLHQRAKEIILQTKKTSISYLQRALGIGFNRAANIAEDLEKEGFLSAPNSKGVREILIN